MLRQAIRNGSVEPTLRDLKLEDVYTELQMAVWRGNKLIPTVAGLILLGRSQVLRRFVPTSECAVQVLSGTNLKINESWIAPMLLSLKRIEELLAPWNTDVNFEDGFFRLTIKDIDLGALREGIINAFCHLDYTQRGQLRVELTDDWLAISNPGGFMNGLTVSNLLEAEACNRNSVLSRAVKRLGLSERAGRGIDRIYEGLLRCGRPIPTYSASTDNRVVLLIPKKVPDESVIRLIRKVQNKFKIELSVYALLILSQLSQHHRLSPREIAASTHTDSERIRICAVALVQIGVIKQIGRSYCLAGEMMKECTDSCLPDVVQRSKTILEVVGTSGEISIRNVVQLFSVSRSTAYRFLNALVQSGQLQAIRQGRNSRYVLAAQLLSNEVE